MNTRKPPLVSILLDLLGSICFIILAVTMQTEPILKILFLILSVCLFGISVKFLLTELGNSRHGSPPND